MKIFDCFMYFDEEIVLDLRLNILDKYVDYFVIVESIFTHRGDKRDLKFNLKKFEKFKDKIIYLVYDEHPKNIEIINIIADLLGKTPKFEFVKDRLGHDKRYALNSNKLREIASDWIPLSFIEFLKEEVSKIKIKEKV